MNSYQTFIRLLYEAHAACKAVDDYDLRNDDDQTWHTLLTEQHAALMTLVRFTQAQGDTIIETGGPI
jgi:hypothetical protein